MMNKYPGYIMRKLRQRRGLEPDNVSSDEILNNFSPQQAFKEVLSWEGLINWDETIKEWINDIYGISIDNNLAQAAPDMYEALKDLLESYDVLMELVLPANSVVAGAVKGAFINIDKARQALRKAEGRTD